MAAEDYFDIDGDPYDGCTSSMDESAVSESLRPRMKEKAPDDLPCRNCRFSSVLFHRCERRKGIDRCPHASWFAERNGNAKSKPKKRMCQCNQCGKWIPVQDYDIYGCVCFDCAMNNMDD